MATIASTVISSQKIAVVETVLTGTADTFTFKTGGKQFLIFRNPTAGALTPVIDGNGSTTVSVDGVGTIDVSTGFSVGSIATGASVSISTDAISAYLKGTIAITGGTGLVASLLEL